MAQTKARSRQVAIWCTPIFLLLLSTPLGGSVSAFVPIARNHDAPATTSRRQSASGTFLSMSNKDTPAGDIPEENVDRSAWTRREAIRSSVSVGAALLAFVAAEDANAFDIPLLTPRDRISTGGQFIPAKRSTCYLVDSTLPPTLVPFKAQREAAILKNLGMGSGTKKTPFIEEGINLNNIMKKTVFGTIDMVENLKGGMKANDGKGGEGYATFVFFGTDYSKPEDTNLVMGLLTDITKPRRDLETALGLAFAPLSTQESLDSYLKDGDAAILQKAMEDAGVDSTTFAFQLPFLQYARSKKLILLALSPELVDIRSVRTNGLQSIGAERRGKYVIDPSGFIGQTQDPKFEMYAEKSLFRDFVPLSEKDSTADFFSERILVHECAASVVAKWAISRPDSLVTIVAPSTDVRFMNGINGRVPRIAKHLNPDTTIDDMAVTTILVNPTAQSTLSQSKFLRLEIGTAPENKSYQTKVADYLWFTSMPKVNMLPRLMNGP